MIPVLPFLLALGLASSDTWTVSRDAAVTGWLSDLGSSLTPGATGVMDLFEAGSLPDDAPGPGTLEDGVMRRRRTAMALQGSVSDTSADFRMGAAWLWERGGWQDEVTWTGGASRQLTGSTWGWGALAAWRPSLQTGGGVVIRQTLSSPEGIVAERRTEGWGLVRYGRLSYVTLGDRSHQSLWELALQVEPTYDPEDAGMWWRELSLGVRRVDADRNAWTDRREVQLFGAVPLWRDKLRLLWQGGSHRTWERMTLQSDLLPQGLVGVDLSYARTRWTGRSWGMRARFMAVSIGFNDPEDIRDCGPTGGGYVLSFRARMAFNGADDYFSPGRHTGPSERISQTTRLR